MEKETMKKLLTICAVAAFVLAVSSIANADVTVETVEYPTANFWDPMASTTDPAYYLWYDEDWGWTHTFDTTLGTVNSATIEIEAYDIDDDDAEPEVDVISADGKDLGPLEGDNDVWAVTTFTLDITDIANLEADGVLNMLIDIDSTSDYWAVTLNYSTLTVDYTPPQPPEPVIPAPGAILLGSIGVGLVGWLRRRRAL